MADDATSARGILARTATAPISWGVCEVPGWGVQLPVDRVLGEMQELGFPATELGSAGYLPSDPIELRELLGRYGLRLTGGFVPLALHDPAVATTVIEQATEAADLLAGGGAFTFVTCAVSDPFDWQRPVLDGGHWSHLAAMLGRVDEICALRGLTQVFHPHVDSLVETADEIQRIVDVTPVSFVLETGHMTIGGFDPLQFAREHSRRVGLVHLKDLRSRIARRLNAEELSLMEAVQAGLFPSLGGGDVPIADIVRALEASAYDGWYVIEQDVAITGAEPAPGDGPIRGVRESVAFIRSVETDIAAALPPGDGGRPAGPLQDN